MKKKEKFQFNLKNFKFHLKGYNENLYFIVIVYQDIKLLRKEGEAFTGEKYPDCLGLCHPYERIIIKNKKEKTDNNIGIIRLSKKHLATHIVAHELIHAAMWHFRLTQPTRTANFGKHNGKKEEDFGMIYAKYFSRMTRLLYKLKLWN